MACLCLGHDSPSYTQLSLSVCGTAGGERFWRRVRSTHFVTARPSGGTLSPGCALRQRGGKKLRRCGYGTDAGPRPNPAPAGFAIVTAMGRRRDCAYLLARDGAAEVLQRRRGSSIVRLRTSPQAAWRKQAPLAMRPDGVMSGGRAQDISTCHPGRRRPALNRVMCSMVR